jgi:hypothetical protein
LGWGERVRVRLGGGVEGAAKGWEVDDGGVGGRRELRCWRRDVREGGEMFILQSLLCVKCFKL